MGEHPNYLYKYINWENPFHRRIITHGEMFFASARRFNDPFDCSAKINYDLATDSDKTDLLSRMFCSAIPNLSEEAAHQAAEQDVSGGPQKFQKYQNLVDYLQEEIVYNRHGIWCASEIRDSMPMWAHYGNNHRGICLVYNLGIIAKALRDYRNEDGLPVALHQVKYVEEYPLVIPGQTSNQERVDRVFAHKALPWSYEKEWRLVLIGAVDIAIPMPPAAIHRVLFGLRVEDSTISEVLEELKRIDCNAEPLRAKAKQRAFALEFHPLDAGS